MSDRDSSGRDIAIGCRRLWKVFGPVSTRLDDVTVDDVSGTCERLRDTGCVVAAANIDLDVSVGEFFVLMGLSGSGKSTLLRCLSRLTEPTAGSVSFDGRDLLALDHKALMDVRRHKMGMVFQHFGLFPHMSVLENVAFPLRVQGVAESERQRKAREMIALVGLQGRERAMTDELSGGQKQRVGIARSLAVDPALWFLDEPFSALDPLIRHQMQSELIELQTRLRKTVVFVTHDFMEAVRLADRIAIMKDGMVEQMGRPADIVLRPATDYVAEFVAEAPRARIVTVGNLVEPQIDPIDSRRSLRSDTTLESALSLAVDGGGAIAVTDAHGKALGCVRPEVIAGALGAGGAGERDAG
ncbi:MAG: ATP-binding cassette domain-containing protein [Gammaproteobacteria bacterium]